MQYRSDPTRRLRRLAAVTLGVGAAAVTGTAWWALRSLPEAPPVVVEPAVAEAPAAVPAGGADLLDPRVFAARLWNPVPPPTTPAPSDEQVASKPPPLRLELVGIINDGGRLRAAVYDPDTDRLHIVSDGDRIRELTVTSVSESHVELTDGRSTRRLSLREETS